MLGEVCVQVYKDIQFSSLRFEGKAVSISVQPKSNFHLSPKKLS